MVLATQHWPPEQDDLVRLKSDGRLAIVERVTARDYRVELLDPELPLSSGGLSLNRAELREVRLDELEPI